MSPSVQFLKVIYTYSFPLLKSIMLEEGSVSWEMPLNTLDGKTGDKSQRRKESKRTLTSMSVQKHPEKSVPI